jgi:hypothetical protein
MKKNNNKLIIFAVAGLFILTGTYNAVVINAESHLDHKEVKFLKRLDEVYGVVKEGREVAGFTSWQKLQAKEAPKKFIINDSPKSMAVSEETPVPTHVALAAVQEELTLTLVEVLNPVKWQQGLTAAQFNGSLTTNNGVIEDLAVSLPGGEGFSANFAEMSGNVFEYELNGELYSGMMYQVNQNSYMVTLTTGPLEGTRMRFSSEAPVDEQIKTHEVLAESNVAVGSFGDTSHLQELVQNDKEIQQEAMQAQTFNLDQSSSL